ncbi:MAG: hypothetical protein NVSMB51_14670 [Solirubrobacteraceae bacterium]
MGIARAAQDFLAPPREAEQLWLDPTRWPAVVDGCARIVEQRGAWPAAGAEVRWQSTPHGRGEVIERVIEHRSGVLHRREVRDAASVGVLACGWEPLEGGVALELTYDYRLVGSPQLIRPLLDALFVRRAQAESLRRTLTLFGRELA